VDKGDIISIDASEFLRGLDMANTVVREAAYKAMWENQLDLEKEAKNLAPVSPKGGTLMRSGNSRRPKWSGFNTLTGEVGFNTPYAAKVHETMWPAVGVSLGRSGAMGVGMMPGPTTRKKPPTAFGEAGGKYLERPLLGKAKIYTERIAKKIKAALGRGRMGTRG
jgi:hypothetical protein